jgi:hypothetical protein
MEAIKENSAPPVTKPRRAVKTAGIAFEIDLLASGRERARRRRQSFSAYINTLIAQDAGQGVTVTAQP